MSGAAPVASSGRWNLGRTRTELSCQRRGAPRGGSKKGTATRARTRGHRGRLDGRGGARHSVEGLGGAGGVEGGRMRAVRAEALACPGGQRCSKGELRP
jgi:hypothetical protein